MTVSTELLADTPPVASASNLIICDPRAVEPNAGVGAAPRLATLDGVTLALIHNGKTHGRELMEYVVEELRSDWNIGELTHLGPPSPGYGGDPDDAAPAAEKVMAAISAIGD